MKKGENHGKPCGNHGKTVGKLWENHRKTVGKPWKTKAKLMKRWRDGGKDQGFEGINTMGKREKDRFSVSMISSIKRPEKCVGLIDILTYSDCSAHY